MSAPSVEVQRQLAQCLARVRRVLLVRRAVALQRGADSLAERPVERGGVLRGVGEDRHVLVPGLVQRVADHADLAVHHAAGAHHMGARVGLDLGHLGVPLQRGVVVDAPVGGQDPAVAVVGVLVQAQVGHDDQLVADLGPHVPQRDLQDAVRVGARRALRVLLRVVRDAEQHDPADTGLDRLDGGLPQRVPGVLDDPGHRPRSAPARRCPPARRRAGSGRPGLAGVSATIRRIAGRGAQPPGAGAGE